MWKSVLNSKIKLFKKSAGTQKCLRNGIPKGYAISQNSAKIGIPMQVYHFNHVILVVKCKFWQHTMYNDQCLI